MQRLVKDLLVTACGAFTSLLTALLMVWLEEVTEVAIYSYNMLYLLPVGAILAGALASLGYYGGAKLFGSRPSSFIMVNMVVVSVASYLLIHYLPYYNVVSQLPPGQVVPSFWVVLHHQISNIELVFDKGDVRTGKLGWLGYPYTMLQVAGFAAGGFFVFRWLAASPYCQTCQQYLVRQGAWSRYWTQAEAEQPLAVAGEAEDAEEKPDPEEAEPPKVYLTDALAAAVDSKDPAGIVSAFAQTGGTAKPKDGGYTATLSVHACKGCSLQHLELATVHGGGEHVLRIEPLCFNDYLVDQPPLRPL